MSACEYVHMSSVTHSSQRQQVTLEQELWTIVNCLTWCWEPNSEPLEEQQVPQPQSLLSSPCLFILWCMYLGACMQIREENLQESLFSFHHAGSRDQPQVVTVFILRQHHLSHRPSNLTYTIIEQRKIFIRLTNSR